MTSFFTILFLLARMQMATDVQLRRLLQPSNPDCAFREEPGPANPLQAAWTTDGSKISFTVFSGTDNLQDWCLAPADPI